MTKSRRSKLSPTKLPRQARSRATVEAILKATADILAKHGYARLTTNGIAERAGVNIASLYQYFPSKQAIVAELRRRHGIEQRAAVRRVLAERHGQDLRATLDALVSMVIAAHLIDPELQRVFSEELPELRYADASAADRPAFADFRAFLERWSGSAGPRSGDVDGGHGLERRDSSGRHRTRRGSVERGDHGRAGDAAE